MIMEYYIGIIYSENCVKLQMKFRYVNDTITAEVTMFYNFIKLTFLLQRSSSNVSFAMHP